MRLHLDELAGKTLHVREVAGRYASLRPSEESVDPVPRRQERSRADAVVEELLAPLEEGWSWEHLVADEISSRKFWDGVLRHAVFVIRASGKEALSAEEILAGLPPPDRQVGRVPSDRGRDARREARLPVDQTQVRDRPKGRDLRRQGGRLRSQAGRWTRSSG